MAISNFLVGIRDLTRWKDLRVNFLLGPITENLQIRVKALLQQQIHPFPNLPLWETLSYEKMPRLGVK